LETSAADQIRAKLRLRSGWSEDSATQVRIETRANL
jgi:hypothetical protein